MIAQRGLKQAVTFSLKSIRRAAALALLGMALNALWPLIANAAPRVDFFSTEICSINLGKAAGSVVGKLPMQLPASKHQNMHCAFCAGGACTASLIGTLPAFVVPTAISRTIPREPVTRLDRDRTFLFAEPRAPPAFLLL